MTPLELLHRNNNGFTLLETLLYSALVTVIVTFSVFAVHHFLDTTYRIKTQKELSENQRFLEQKIQWVLQSVSTINSPALNATSTSLSVDKIGYGSNPAVIDVDSGIARLKKGTGSAIPITSDYSYIQELNFHRFSLSGRPAIKISGLLLNSFASTSVEIDTTIVTQ